MNCPVCKSELTAAKYENVPVKVCGTCEGHLVRVTRLGAIKTRREKTDDDFLLELSTPHGTDSKDPIFCPSCSRRMTKRRQVIGVQRFYIDECKKCDYVWLDAGELAKIQLHYEESEQGKEMLRFHDRLADMSPQERAELDERIAKLPNARILDPEDRALLAYLWSRGL